MTLPDLLITIAAAAGLAAILILTLLTTRRPL